MYGIKSYPFRPSFCFFALYLLFYRIYNYILLFPVLLVIIIIIIIIITSAKETLDQVGRIHFQHVF